MRIYFKHVVNHSLVRLDFWGVICTMSEIVKIDKNKNECSTDMSQAMWPH